MFIKRVLKIRLSIQGVSKSGFNYKDVIEQKAVDVGHPKKTGYLS